MCIAVIYHAVDAGAVHRIALRFEVKRTCLPLPGVGRSGKSLRAGDLPAIHVRNGGRQLGVDDNPAVPAAARPELAHRDVAEAAVLEVVGRAAAVGFTGKEQAGVMRQLREISRVGFGEQVGHHPPEIPQEALRHVGRIHNPSGEYRQEVEYRIAAARLKLLLEPLRPVLRADFVAVDQYIVESRSVGAVRSAQRGEYRADMSVPVGFYGFAAELVAFQACPFRRRRVIRAAVDGVAHPEDCPIALRRFPCGGFSAGREQPLRQVDHHALLYRHFRRRPGRGVFLFKKHKAFAVVMVRRRGNHPCRRIFRRRGKSQHGNVAVKIGAGFRLRRRRRYGRPAFYLHLACYNRFHAVFRGIPRPAAVRPARAVVHAQRQPQPFRFGRRMFHHREPFRAVKPYGAGGNI